MLPVLTTFLTTFFVQLQRDKDREDEFHDLIANENIKLEEIRDRQETLNSQLIDVLCGAVEAKDLYTRGHSLRVAQYAREIMYRLGGDEKAQNEVYSIGILHDVGKIRIPDEIINKKGALTDEEFEQLIGYPIPEPARKPRRPFTMENCLEDTKETFWGNIIIFTC